MKWSEKTMPSSSVLLKPHAPKKATGHDDGYSQDVARTGTIHHGIILADPSRSVIHPIPIKYRFIKNTLLICFYWKFFYKN